MEQLAAASAGQLLEAAADRLGRPCTRMERAGRVEREVVVAQGADLLICARDGDPTRLDPHSLGPDARYVVDHSPCPVLLIWPTEPLSATLPPPPTIAPHPPGHRH